jgi:hypothetical protein
MRSSRERFGRVRGRFRSEVAGIARLPSRVYKIIHLAVFVGVALCLRVTEHAGSVTANAVRSRNDIVIGLLAIGRLPIVTFTGTRDGVKAGDKTVVRDQRSGVREKVHKRGF